MPNARGSVYLRYALEVITQALDRMGSMLLMARLMFEERFVFPKVSVNLVYSPGLRRESGENRNHYSSFTPWKCDHRH